MVLARPDYDGSRQDESGGDDRISRPLIATSGYLITATRNQSAFSLGNFLGEPTVSFRKEQGFENAHKYTGRICSH
jgi:hypothetical protein